MPSVVYMNAAGAVRTIEASAGQSVMEAAVQNGVGGVVGQCGGSLACASCHVYVDAAWTERVGGPSELEDEMLDGALAERRAESRLSCQIRMCDDFDGLTVEIAPEQL